MLLNWYQLLTSREANVSIPYTINYSSLIVDVSEFDIKNMTNKLREKLTYSPYRSREEIMVDARKKASQFVKCFKKENLEETNTRKKELREGIKKQE